MTISSELNVSSTTACVLPDNQVIAEMLPLEETVRFFAAINHQPQLAARSEGRVKGDSSRSIPQIISFRPITDRDEKYAYLRFICTKNDCRYFVYGRFYRRGGFGTAE
jgi:hypothetical protein